LKFWCGRLGPALGSRPRRPRRAGVRLAMRSANAWQAERLPVWGVLGGSPKQDRVVRTKISWKRFEVIQKFRGILASMSVIEEIPFSQLVQHPKATMAKLEELSLIHISEPTRLGMISYAVFCLKKKTTLKRTI